MKILVINSGSSSIKYKLIDMDMVSPLAEGLLERIGEPMGTITHIAHPGTSNAYETRVEAAVPDHGQGMKTIVSLLTSPKTGVIESKSAISAIGHRVVQGGEQFTRPVPIDDTVISGIRANIPLAPLHNPGALAGILNALEMFPDTLQVAVFDTAFHQTIPSKAFRYAIPHRFYQDAGIRRFGFHGTSHGYITHETARLLGKPVEETNLISLHLGNGSSITAIREGKSVDTSMGMTPLDGVIMGTRCGAIDPAIIAHLSDSQGMDLQEIMTLLTRESGIKGLCGYNDLRDVHHAIAKGDEQAALALEMLIYSYRHYVGAYFTVLGQVDALVFTAGIGENDAVIREGVCKNLEILGIELDPDLNAGIRGGEGIISKPGSRVCIMVIPTNEELEIARQVRVIAET
jgi:acetate kinase